MRKLVVVNPGAVQRRADGFVAVSSKTLTGVQAYARGWSGETLWVTREVTMEGDGLSEANLGTTWVDPSEQQFLYRPTEDVSGLVRSLGADTVVLVLLKEWAAPLLDTQASVAFVSELSLRTRIQQSIDTSAGTIGRVRVIAGEVRGEAKLRAMVRAAAGLQANGFPTWHAYGKFSASPLLFFDTRLQSDQIPSTPRQPRQANTPIRLGFSGRHIRGKGPEYALQLVRELNRNGTAATLDVFGRGELEPYLRATAGSDVRFHGDVRFDEEWVPFVRDNIDLMVLPHVQGDPAGTYLEAAGLGVPILGFNNDALRALTREAGIGWTVGMRDSRALLAKASEIAASPNLWAHASRRGIEFMAQHSFEREFERRLAHLEALS